MTPLPPDDRELDRLIDDELDGVERRALLRRLDATPDGWRRCALAFLEAQSWRLAIGEPDRSRNGWGEWSAGSSRPEVANPIASGPTRSPRRRQILTHLGRAAAIALVFGVGWGAGRLRTAAPGDPAPQNDPLPAQVAQIDPRPASAAPAAPPRWPLSYPEALLERQGFRIEHRTVLVPARTPSGQPVAVPVDQTKVRFVGNRSV